MQIHELNTGTPATTDYLAMDSGSDTYKVRPGDIKPAYTSGDDASPSAWETVGVVTTGLSFYTLFQRITAMMKNVRFLKGQVDTLNSNLGIKVIATDTISSTHLSIPISNYSQYKFFIMEASLQSWLDTYVWSTYAAAKKLTFGYNGSSSARCDFSSTGFTFSDLSLASGQTSFSVRVFGVKMPTFQ